MDSDSEPENNGLLEDQEIFKRNNDIKIENEIFKKQVTELYSQRHELEKENEKIKRSQEENSQGLATINYQVSDIVHNIDNAKKKNKYLNGNIY